MTLYEAMRWHSRAFLAWAANPTPEGEAEVRRALDAYRRLRAQAGR